MFFLLILDKDIAIGYVPFPWINKHIQLNFSIALLVAILHLIDSNKENINLSEV